jgi:hypothetical protein
MREYDAGQADRLAAQLGAHEVVAAVGAVALVEHQVGDVEDAVEPGRQRGGRRDLQPHALGPQLTPGAHQSLGHRGRARQQGRRDLLDGEAAHRLQREGDAGRPREHGVTAHEDHRQLVVVHAPRGDGVCAVGRPGPDRLEPVVQHTLAAEHVERAVARDLEQPPARVVGHAPVGPRRQRAEQRVLHDLLGEVEPVGAQPAGQHGDHASGAVTEQVIDEPANRVTVLAAHGTVRTGGPSPRSAEARASRPPGAGSR